MTIPGIPNPAVPYGSLIVVTGASGFIGAHVVDQVLAAGFRVRGTSRDATRSAWLQDLFEEKHGQGRFELCTVPDVTAEHAFEEAVKGAAGFIHVAHDMQGPRDSGHAIAHSVNGAINALKAFALESQATRFVYTSSSFAVTLPKPNKSFAVSTATFNEDAIQYVQSQSDNRGLAFVATPGEAVYAASKVQSERALQDWVNAHEDSSIVVNTVQPNANIGSPISPAHQGYPTSSRWVKALWEHDYKSLIGTAPQHWINVEDTARLHVIGIADPEVVNERLFGMVSPTHFNEIIDVLRRNFPEKSWDDFPDGTRDLCNAQGPMMRTRDLLRKAYRKEFTSLEVSVLQNVPKTD